MNVLTKGANAPLPCQRILAELGWFGVHPELDVCALLLGPAGKVRSDADFVFYNQRAAAGVRHLGKTSPPQCGDTLRLDLDAVPADVGKLIIAASVDGGTAASVDDLHLVIRDADTGTSLLRFNVTDGSSETALILAEVYRRDGQWKVRAVGQGYASGLAGLATDFGIHVEAAAPTTGAPPPPPVPPVTPSIGTPTPRPAGIDWLHPPVPAGYELS